MSSDEFLRHEVRDLLQDVVNARKYQQGSLMYPIRGAGAYVGGALVGGAKKLSKSSKFLNTVEGLQCYKSFLENYKPKEKKKITEVERIDKEIEYIKKSNKADKEFNNFYNTLLAIDPNQSRSEALKLYKQAKKEALSDAIKEAINIKKKEGKGGKRRKCKKGYRRKCVKGRGNIYDYQYGDGMDSESDDEYEGYGTEVGGTEVGGKRRRYKKKRCVGKRGKKLSPWICRVKAYAKKHKVSYKEALQDLKGSGLGNMFYN
jgi:hypothetical protein